MLRIALLALLLISSSRTYAATVDTLMVKSSAMNKTIPNLIILPENYYISRQNFEVVYLLHGAGDDYRGWLRISPELRNYADNYNLILVCADGGKTSWYFDSPVDDTYKYETYISKELVNNTDKNFRTKANRKSRAITGLSMGGHGAFYLAMRHPDIFGAAGSMSGGLDIRPFSNQWNLHLRLGSKTDYNKNWENHTVINMVPLLKGRDVKLIFDCGTEDFFYDVNVKFKQALQKNNIPHTFYSRPGGHTVAYWRESIKTHLIFFRKFFNTSGLK